MRTLLPILALCLALPAAAQTPPPAAPATPPPQTQPAKPQTAKPRPPRAPKEDPAAARGLVLTVQVTNTFGQSLEGVRITAAGPVARDGITDPGGLVRFAGMRPGEYRLRLEKEGQVTLEKDVTLATGKSIAIDATMTDAPKPPPPPPAPAPNAAPTGPPGEPRVMSISDFLDKNLIGNREPMKQSMLGCSGVQRSVLLQVRDPLQEQTDDQLDQTLYVVAGQGTLKLGGREHPLSASSFAIIPRGTPFSLTRGKSNALIVLLSRANEACASGAAAANK
jgi:mannose-6-phosphate isomerase-like protein (cupin superfamily)